MLTLELLKLTEEYVQYKFFPEGNEDNFGIVQVSLKNYLDRFVVKDAYDVSDVYHGMAMVRVGMLVKAGEFPQKSGMAWG